MRADRLLALVLVLRSRRRVTAAGLAAELEVSERTVLRDIEALSNAGVPVYTERGRNGGFRLMDGWSTDLSGLSGAEARSLLVAGSSTAAELGLGPAFATALAKVLSSVPGEHRREAELEAARILVVDDGFVSRRETLPALAATQRAVTGGRRLLISYRRRPVDPMPQRPGGPSTRRVWSVPAASGTCWQPTGGIDGAIGCPGSSTPASSTNPPDTAIYHRSPSCGNRPGRNSPPDSRSSGSNSSPSNRQWRRCAPQP